MVWKGHFSHGTVTETEKKVLQLQPAALSVKHVCLKQGELSQLAMDLSYATMTTDRLHDCKLANFFKKAG